MHKREQVSIYLHTCAHECTYLLISAYVRKMCALAGIGGAQVSTCVHRWADVCRVHMCAHSSACMSMYVLVSTYVHMPAHLFMCVCSHVCTCVCMSAQMCSWFQHVRMQVRMCISMHRCSYMCICVLACACCSHAHACVLHVSDVFVCV